MDRRNILLDFFCRTEMKASSVAARASSECVVNERLAMLSYLNASISCGFIWSGEIFSLTLFADEESFLSLGVESRLLPGADDAKSSVWLMGETPPLND